MRPWPISLPFSEREKRIGGGEGGGDHAMGSTLRIIASGAKAERLFDKGKIVQEVNNPLKTQIQSSGNPGITLFCIIIVFL